MMTISMHCYCMHLSEVRINTSGTTPGNKSYEGLHIGSARGLQQRSQSHGDQDSYKFGPEVPGPVIKNRSPCLAGPFGRILTVL